MAATDPRIDAYMAKAAGFGQPILAELRRRVHAACPEIDESIKWGAPAFLYKKKILAVMASFKQHVAFNLWHGAQVVGEGAQATEGMGQFGKLTSVDDIPGADEMSGYLRKAMKLIEEGASGGRRKAEPKPRLAAPADLLAALAGNARAHQVFNGFPPGKQRDYVDWILDAKRDETRRRRVAQAVEWLAEGKARHWKYQDC